MIAFLISEKNYQNYLRLFSAAYIIGFLDTILDIELTNFMGIAQSIGYGIGVFLNMLLLFGFAQLINRIVTGNWFNKRYEKMWFTMLIILGTWLIARILGFIFPEISNQI